MEDNIIMKNLVSEIQSFHINEPKVSTSDVVFNCEGL